MRWLWAGVAALMCACGFDASAPSVGGADDDTMCEWPFRRTLTFDNAARTEDLVDFPVAIVLEPSRFDYDTSTDDGRDLRFFDADGTLLAHEIEKWNPMGTSVIWVNVPQIDAGSSSDSISMLYGNESAPSVEDAEAVWDANFCGVWHGADITSGVLDSTKNNNDGNAFGSYNVRGQVGDGMVFDGDNDYVEIPDSDSLRITGMTLEAWGRFFETVPDGYVTLVEHARSTDNWYGLWKTSGGPQFMMLWANGDALDFKQTIEVDTWYYVAGTLDLTNKTATTYLDGTPDGTAMVSLDPQPGPGVVRFGANVSDGERLRGYLDEVRISNTVRSADWISAQYDSMNESFVTYGEQRATCP